jgi:hypothetical protein
MSSLRDRLVTVALEWERAFINAPSITAAISEYDAAVLLGLSDRDYSEAMKGSTSVQKGYDFKFKGVRYQVKGTRPSGKPGSKITRVPGVTNYHWDRLVWISYNPKFEIQEAWLWAVENYREAFQAVNRLSPEHMRKGMNLLHCGVASHSA